MAFHPAQRPPSPVPSRASLPWERCRQAWEPRAGTGEQPLCPCARHRTVTPQEARASPSRNPDLSPAWWGPCSREILGRREPQCPASKRTASCHPASPEGHGHKVWPTGPGPALYPLPFSLSPSSPQNGVGHLKTAEKHGVCYPSTASHHLSTVGSLPPLPGSLPRLLAPGEGHAHLSEGHSLSASWKLTGEPLWTLASP